MNILLASYKQMSLSRICTSGNSKIRTSFVAKLHIHRSILKEHIYVYWFGLKCLELPRIEYYRLSLLNAYRLSLIDSEICMENLLFSNQLPNRLCLSIIYAQTLHLTLPTWACTTLPLLTQNSSFLCVSSDRRTSTRLARLSHCRMAQTWNVRLTDDQKLLVIAGGFGFVAIVLAATVCLVQPTCFIYKKIWRKREKGVCLP